MHVGRVRLSPLSQWVCGLRDLKIIGAKSGGEAIIIASNHRADEARNMSYRLLESGNRPSVDVGDSTEARLELEPLADSAGPRNIVLALARFTSDSEEISTAPRRAATAERIGTQLASAIKRWLK